MIFLGTLIQDSFSFQNRCLFVCSRSQIQFHCWHGWIAEVSIISMILFFLWHISSIRQKIITLLTQSQFDGFSTMTSISIQNLTTSAHILGLAELSGTISTPKISHTTYNGSIRTPELATIILAIVVFAGGLATAFCVVCVRYKRWAHI